MDSKRGEMVLQRQLEIREVKGQCEGGEVKRSQRGSSAYLQIGGSHEYIWSRSRGSKRSFDADFQGFINARSTLLQKVHVEAEEENDLQPRDAIAGTARLSCTVKSHPHKQPLQQIGGLEA